MHDDLQRTRYAIDHATEGMTLDEMSWHPAGKWCTAEVLEHLALGVRRKRETVGARSVPTARARHQIHIEAAVSDWVVTGREIFCPAAEPLPRWSRREGCRLTRCFRRSARTSTTWTKPLMLVSQSLGQRSRSRITRF